MPDYVDPKHAKATADGWNRLREILEEAMQDKTIVASGGTMDFVELILGIIDEPSILTAENNVAPLKPLTKEAEDKAKKVEAKNNELLGRLHKAKRK